MEEKKVVQRDNWDEWGGEEVQIPTKSLFSEEIFSSPDEFWKYAASQYNFDIVDITKKWRLTTYDHIKLVNYLRTHATTIQDVVKSLTNEPTAPWRNDQYLRPVIPDDPLLTCADFGDDCCDDSTSTDDDEVLAPTYVKKSEDLSKLSSSELILRLERAQNALLSAKMTIAQQESTIHQLREVTKKQILGEERLHPPSGSRSRSGSQSRSSRSQSPSRPDLPEEEDYFSSYAHFGIHQQMIADTVRTESYRNFILKNPELFKGKVVMDVGCGTGILSYFCSQVGAKKVFSIDNSDIIDVAKKVAAENSMHNIQFIKKKVELIDTLGPDYSNVDIIISEWMGYCLLFECMLPSVLIARDRFCANGGLVYPDIASMFICGWDDEKYYNNKISFWTEVYGFKMNSMKEQIWIEPQTENIPQSSINTDSFMFKSFNINTVKIDELDFTSPFHITITNSKILHGFVVYFDIGFNQNCTNPISFSTGPQTKDTHWHQTIFILKNPEQVEQNDVVKGTITCRRKKHLRNLYISISYSVQGRPNTTCHYTL